MFNMRRFIFFLSVFIHFQCLISTIPQPDYEHLTTITPTFATHDPRFIKMLSNHWLVVYDAQGHGEIFDGNDEYQTICSFEIKDYENGFFYIRNIFYYVDPDGQELLVVYGEMPWFYLINVGKRELAKMHHVGFPFRIFQQRDEILLLENDETFQMAPIYPTWKDAKLFIASMGYIATALQFRHGPFESFVKYSVRPEGLLGHYKAINFYRTAMPLRVTLCDPNSLNEPEHTKLLKTGKYLDTRFSYVSNPLCYHMTTDRMLYTAYSGGLVIVWDKIQH